MPDYWKLTKDYAPGDLVQQVVLGAGLTPYVGKVSGVHPGPGFVDVQWPFGAERVSAERLLKVSPAFAQALHPSLSVIPTEGKVASSQWRTTEVPPGFHKELAKLFRRGAREVKAYDELWHRFASFSDDEAIRDEVSKFYLFASNALDMMLQQHAQKTAMYWVSQNRTHRATRAEVDSRCPSCPRCGTAMRKTTYKMDKGSRARLFACPKDLYLIKQTDILGPEGQPVEW